MTKLKNLILIAIILANTTCKEEHYVISHQRIINLTTHSIKIITYRYNHIDSVNITPKNIYLRDIYSTMGQVIELFDNADSIHVFIDTAFCNVYWRCALIKEPAERNKCYSDSFNILNPITYKFEMIKKYEYIYTFFIDEKYCTHCK